MLVVIDMQPRFHAMHSIIDRVISEVEKAVAKNEWIIFLTVGPGRTAYRVKRPVRGYRKTFTLRKYRNDGASEIFNVITRRSYWRNAKVIGQIRSIKICGVNTGACVYSTVRSLSYLKVSITVLGHAVAQCRDGYSYEYNKTLHFTALRAMQRLNNVSVIQPKRYKRK